MTTDDLSARNSNDVDVSWWHDEGAIPVGAPFRPGLDPLPTHHHAWAVVKDRLGRPAHGEPRGALRPIVTRVPAIGPNDALGYVLHAGLTYNTVFAARGVPLSVFDLHDEDAHVVGSGAVVIVAAVGSEVAREGRLKVGELRVLYPGVSNLLSPRAGQDPMHADFRIQGYETPRGSFAQFVHCQAPQLLAHSQRLTLAEGASFMLDLETVYKALVDVARVQPGEHVFVEGAAGGTGLYAVACAALRRARVTGLVSTDKKGKLVLERGAQSYVNRLRLELAGVFTPVPTGSEDLRAWIAAGEPFRRLVREAQGGRDVDVVVSSVGRDVFPRMVSLLGPSGRVVFYGATTGYTFTFVGKPGAASVREMLSRADVRPNEGVLVYYGADTSLDDPVGTEAIAAAAAAGARVAAVTRTDAQAKHVLAGGLIAGAVSLETLARAAGFRWPQTMPDYDTDVRGYREYQDATLKPLGQAIGRLLAAPGNPRGAPDVVLERAHQDTLGISTFIARPFTGRVVYAEDTDLRRLSFYAPNVWMHQKRVLFPTFAILGSHLSNAHQAEEVVRLIEAGALPIHSPRVHPWDECPEANQAIAENRHRGTLAIRVGATAALDHARTARQVYEAWGSRFVDGRIVKVRLDPLRPGVPETVAIVTIDLPPANAIGRDTLDELERVLDALDREPRLRAVVLTGAGAMFVAGADIRQLRAFTAAGDVTAFAARAQDLFTRIGRSGAPWIAAIDGYALGGGNELQMACAYRVASARAELGQPEINLHVIPGFGGTQMLPRLAVRHAQRTGSDVSAALVRALTILLDGRRRSAADAVSAGIVDELAPADALSHALDIARRIAVGTFEGTLWSPLAQSSTIDVPAVDGHAEIRRLLGHHDRVPRAEPARTILDLVKAGLAKGLAHGIAAEAEAFGRLVASEGGRAGLDRFLARRSLPLPLRRV